jgi:hypothetical protein
VNSAWHSNQGGNNQRDLANQTIGARIEDALCAFAFASRQTSSELFVRADFPFVEKPLGLPERTTPSNDHRELGAASRDTKPNNCEEDRNDGRGCSYG